MEYVLDIDGNKVFVGDFVEILEIDENIKPDEEEKERVMSILGDVLEVDEIDAHGCAWVTKYFTENKENTTAHGIALEKNQMRIVKNEITS